jgi:hypothetical protein
MEDPVRAIHPSLFARLMQLPKGVRADVLEFMGATPVADAQLEHMLNYINTLLEKQARHSLPESVGHNA